MPRLRRSRVELATRLLAGVWAGMSIDAAVDAALDANTGNFETWERQLGEQGAVRQLDV